MGTKILFVDDEAEIRDLMSINLEALGVEVDTASSGNRGLKKLQSDQYDLVISDVKMADGNGVELLQHMNDLGIKIPVIFLTAYLEYDSEKLMQMGAIKVFYKPTKFAVIEDYICRMFKLQQC